jgi:uncharacterized protein YcfJ
VAERGRWIQAWAAVLLAGNLPAADYFDYADVTAVEPLVETAGSTPLAAICRGDTAIAVADEGRGVVGLVEAIREDLDMASCEAGLTLAERVVGYRVTYRYGGSEYVNVLNEDPGPKLRVQVRLEPGP